MVSVEASTGNALQSQRTKADKKCAGEYAKEKDEKKKEESEQDSTESKIQYNGGSTRMSGT